MEISPGGLAVAVGNKRFTVSQRYVDMATLVILRGLLLLIQLVFQVLIARFFGAAAMGVVQIFVSYTTTLGEACLLGKPANLMRQLSKASPSDASSHSATAFVLYSLALALAAIACTTLLGTIAIFMAPNIAKSSTEWLWSIPWALIGYCGVRCFSESLKAIGKTKLALCAEIGTLPILMGLTLLFLSQDSIVLFVKIYAGGFIATGALLGTLFLYGCKRHFVGEATINASVHNQWRSLWFSGMLGIIYGQFAILALPYFTDLYNVGINSAALRYITLTTTLLMVLASYFSPKFANADGDPRKLRSLLKQSQLASVIVFTPFAILFIAVPEFLLSLFGSEFQDAKPVLQLLSIAQLVNAATGIPGVLLKMAGKAQWEQNILIICLLFALLGLFSIGAYNAGFGVMVVFCGLIMLKNCLSYIAARRLITQLTHQGVETHV